MRIEALTGRCRCRAADRAPSPAALPPPAPPAAAEPPASDAAEAETRATTRLSKSAESRPSTTTPSSRRSWSRRRPTSRPPTALERASPTRERLLGETAHQRLIACTRASSRCWPRGERDKARTALYQHEIGELTETARRRRRRRGQGLRQGAAVGRDAQAEPVGHPPRVRAARAVAESTEAARRRDPLRAGRPRRRPSCWSRRASCSRTGCNDAGGALESTEGGRGLAAGAVGLDGAREASSRSERDLGDLARV